MKTFCWKLLEKVFGEKKKNCKKSIFFKIFKKKLLMEKNLQENYFLSIFFNFNNFRII